MSLPASFMKFRRRNAHLYRLQAGRNSPLVKCRTGWTQQNEEQVSFSPGSP